MNKSCLAVLLCAEASEKAGGLAVVLCQRSFSEDWQSCWSNGFPLRC